MTQAIINHKEEHGRTDRTKLYEFFKGSLTPGEVDEIIQKMSRLDLVILTGNNWVRMFT